MCNYLSFCLSGVSFRSLQSVGWGILGVGAGEWGGGVRKGQEMEVLRWWEAERNTKRRTQTVT